MAVEAGKLEIHSSGQPLENGRAGKKQQTIKDNVSLFTPPILEKISQVVVKAGHSLVKDKGEKIRGRCDSTVVETDVHFPTDINLLLDAMRKVITMIAWLCGLAGLSMWRQSSLTT